MKIFLPLFLFCLPISVAAQCLEPVKTVDLPVPQNSKIFIAPTEEFYTRLAQTIRKKKLKVILVKTEDDADFIIDRADLGGFVFSPARSKDVLYTDVPFPTSKGEREAAERLVNYLKEKTKTRDKNSSVPIIRGFYP